MKEYKNLEDFYFETKKYLATIDKKLNPKEAISYVRNNFDKRLLDFYLCIGKLNNDCKRLSGAKTDKIKFSTDSLIKNMINHPDIDFNNYKKLYGIITKPDKIRLSKNKRNCILLLKKYGKTYQAVIKTTQNREENFLTSFRFAEH